MLITLFNAVLIVIITWIAYLYFDLREKAMPAQERYSQLVRGVASIIDRLEGYDHAHSREIAGLSTMIGAASGLNNEQLQSLSAAAMLHDIGELLLPRSIMKSTKRLEGDDLELLRTHTLLGELHLKSQIDGLDEVPSLIRWHHERWDGLGYPDNLKGEEIPVASRIIALADAISAMKSQRSYRSRQFARTDDVVAEVKRLSGMQFDPQLVKNWLDIGNPVECKQK
ncbi:MAG: response regulator receiver modulated metal dependent phosphohydrolase [uncultured bacterium]|nr:MAG: response regulator receiver modulated metal dependent phosphohydrolase [uncultured bacterium]